MDDVWSVKTHVLYLRQSVSGRRERSKVRPQPSVYSLCGSVQPYRWFLLFRPILLSFSVPTTLRSSPSDGESILLVPSGMLFNVDSTGGVIVSEFVYYGFKIGT